MVIVAAVKGEKKSHWTHGSRLYQKKKKLKIDEMVGLMWWSSKIHITPQQILS